MFVSRQSLPVGPSGRAAERVCRRRCADLQGQVDGRTSVVVSGPRSRSREEWMVCLGWKTGRGKSGGMAHDQRQSSDIVQNDVYIVWNKSTVCSSHSIVFVHKIYKTTRRCIQRHIKDMLKKVYSTARSKHENPTLPAIRPSPKRYPLRRVSDGLENGLESIHQPTTPKVN